MARPGMRWFLGVAMALLAPLALAAPPKPTGKTPPATSASASASSATMAKKPLGERLTGDAKADYEAAVNAYGVKDFTNARAKYLAAYTKSKDAELLFNVALCERGLKRYVKARNYMRRYLDEGKDTISTADAESANKFIEAAGSFITTLKIEVTPDGAEIVIDDEPLGTAPLGAPIDIDIGARKIVVKKAGFKSFDKTVPVDVEKDAKLVVKLDPDNKEGTLTLNVPAGATISIDGKTMGKGTWSGVLPAGPHAVRVSADGMRTYQGDVVVADGAARSVDIKLEAETVAAPPEEHWLLHPLELSVAGVQGWLTRNDNPSVTGLSINLGFRLGRRISFGPALDFGKVSGGKCGADALLKNEVQSHGTMVELRDVSNCRLLGGGLMLTGHILPGEMFDPWFGLMPNFTIMSADATVFDSAVGKTRPADGPSDTQMLLMIARVGVDYHPLRSFRGLFIGALLSYAHRAIAQDKFGTSDGGGSPDRISGQNDVPSGPGEFLFGLRLGLGD